VIIVVHTDIFNMPTFSKGMRSKRLVTCVMWWRDVWKRLVDNRWKNLIVCGGQKQNEPSLYTFIFNVKLDSAGSR